MAYGYTLLTVLLACILSLCSGACTFPSAIRGSWISSEKNNLYFGDSYLSGYQVHTFSTDNFTCEELSGTQYLVKSDAFTQYGLQFYAYMCLDFTEITSVSTGDLYIYYKASAAESGANNERVVFKLASLGISGISEVCTIDPGNYTTIRYSVLMKNDSISNVKSRCPLPFLGDFAYSYDTGSGNLCTNDSSLTVCTGSKDTMTWDYTQCSQIQAYSATGITYCVYATSSNDIYTVHVYNTDTSTDQSTTYRFTCYQAYGYETVYAAQYPGDCPDAMNYSYVASPGATLSLNASVVCAYDDDDTTLSAGAIAGIVLAVLFLIILVIVCIIYYLHYRRKKQKEKELEAANRKVDPDALSPNMRLGLPDETKYDLDRLMYSPEAKNGHIKRSQRKDMAVLEGLEGYNGGSKYMDEEQRQTAIDASLFAEKRKRKDNKNEFEADRPANKQFLGRVKDMAKGKRRPFRASALAKLIRKPRARPMGNTPSESGRNTTAKDVVIQVEEADAEGKRKTRFADQEEGAASKTPGKQTPSPRKEKKLEDIETLSDIVDNEFGVDDLSDDNKEPRLILPNLKPEKKERKKRQKDQSSLGVASRRHSDMPRNTRFVPGKMHSRENTMDEFVEPAPLVRGNPNLASLPPLARIHRKDNPKAWKEAFGDKNGMESIDLEELKKNLPENRWKKLLEELYRDKKYFDYVKNSTSTTEKDLFTSADESLQYLYGRALFWESQQPVPVRPPEHVKRMYSRYENTSKPNSNTNYLTRSSTTRSSRKQIARTPTTQVSRLRKREAMNKKDKRDSANDALSKTPNGDLPSALLFFEGGTQTDFSPVPPLTPVMITDDRLVEEVDLTSLPGSTMADQRQATPAPYLVTKEVTKSDIRLEEFDELQGDQQYDAEAEDMTTGRSTVIAV